ncbi:MAG: hypothetical protein F6J93_06870 [Oscillatoria sp. SIO1A7]|nr:hypothetical protein [Oscillatoria sp. SIO1A7]
MTNSKSSLIFWLSLSLSFAGVYALMALQRSFIPYLIQDDARQHVFWMQRFVDPDLFPNDLIADYFQSVAPAGYTSLYKLLAWAGVNPLLSSKLLPLVLGLIMTAYAFGVCLELLPVPLAGFIATILLNQCLWMQDGLISATPKAFVYPLLMPVLYYWLRKKLLATSIALILLGLFYPQGVLIGAGVFALQLVQWQNGRPCPSRNRRDYLLSGIGLGVAFLVLLPYALTASDFGPTIAAFQAKQLPEFLPGGRTEFFINDPWRFWFSSRGGLRLSLEPPLMAFGILLPLLLGLSLGQKKALFYQRFPLVQKVSSKIKILWQLLLSSLVLFFAAHALLFALHLPSRYTQHSLRIVIAIAAGIVLTIVLDSLLFSNYNKATSGNKSNLLSAIEERRPKVTSWEGLGVGRGGWGVGTPTEEKPTPNPSQPTSSPSQEGNKGWVSQKSSKQSIWRFGNQFWRLAIALALFSFLIFYPISLKKFPWTGYVVGDAPSLYKFLQQQPKDSLIASLSEEANNLPAFAGRSILVGREYAIPYHLGYYNEFRQRTIALIQAQYSPDLADARKQIEKYGIDLWLIDRGAFSGEYIAANRWLSQYRVAAEAIASLSQGSQPALAAQVEPCSVFQSDRFLVLEADCIIQQ